MKKKLTISYIKSLLLLVGLWFGSILGYGQNYVMLSDASGYDRSAYEEGVEIKATELITMLSEADNLNNTDYSSNFKVFDSGLYLHNTDMDSSLEEFIDVAIAEADNLSSFYLMLVKISNDDGLYQSITPVIKLPNITNTCYTIEDYHLYVGNTINSNYNGNPLEIEKALIAGIEELRIKLEKTIYCCAEGGNNLKSNNANDLCLPCKSQDEVIADITAQNYYQVVDFPVTVDESGPIPTVYIENENRETGESRYNLTEEMSRFKDESLSLGFNVNTEIIFIDEDCESISSVLNGPATKSNNSDFEDIAYVFKNVNDSGQTEYRLFIQDHPDFFGSQGSNFSVDGRINKSASVSNFVKRAFKFLLGRAVACSPIGVVGGVMLDYALTSAIEWFFINPDSDSYFGILWKVTKRRGLLGAVATVGQQYVDGSPIADCGIAVVLYYVETDYDDWNHYRALTACIVGGIVSAVVKGSGYFISNHTNLAPLIDDFVEDIGSNFNIFTRAFLNPRLIKAWKVFFPDELIRKNVAWLQKLDDYLSVSPNKLKEVTDMFAIEKGKNRVTAYLRGLLERKHFDGIVFRGDKASVTPDKAFNNGIPAQGTHDNLIKHLDGGGTNKGNFVSTSKDITIANGFANKNGYVFKVNSRKGKGVDVNNTLGDQADNWFPEQIEVSMSGGINKADIIGAYPKGSITDAHFIPNPNYIPD